MLLDDHFVIYMMKLQSPLMINVPLNIEVTQLLATLTNPWRQQRCIASFVVRFLHFDIDFDINQEHH